MPQLKTDLSLNSLIDLMGVPGYLLMILSPSLVQKARQHPSTFKNVARILIILSVVVAASRYCTTLVNSIWDNCISSVSIQGHDLLSTAFWNDLEKVKYRSTSRVDEAESGPYARRNRPGSVLWSSKHKDRHSLFYNPAGWIDFWRDGRWFRVCEVTDEGESKTLIQTLGLSNQPIKTLLDKVWKKRLQDQARYTDVYHAREGQWHYLTTKRSRSRETIDHHDETLISALIKDAEKFLTLECEAHYAAKGIPYTRGYLLYGPPGTGKTSMAMVLAGELELDIQIISLVDPGLTDAQLATLFGRLEKPSIVLLEDVDDAGLGRETTTMQDSSTAKKERAARPRTKEVKTSQITLSGLLNALDGVCAPDGCIMIMTTNFREHLDFALIRPGRTDKRTEFPNAGKVVARKAFLRFMAPEDPVKAYELAEAAEKFAAIIPEGQLSPAQLQAFLLDCDGSSEAALNGVEAWVNKELAETH